MVIQHEFVIYGYGKQLFNMNCQTYVVIMYGSSSTVHYYCDGYQFREASLNIKDGNMYTNTCCAYMRLQEQKYGSNDRASQIFGKKSRAPNIRSNETGNNVKLYLISMCAIIQATTKMQRQACRPEVVFAFSVEWVIGTTCMPTLLQHQM